MKDTKENTETLPPCCMPQTQMSEQKRRMEDLEGSFQIAEKNNILITRRNLYSFIYCVVLVSFDVFYEKRYICELQLQLISSDKNLE